MDTISRSENIAFSTTIRGHDLTFHSTWGLFMPRSVDVGSRLLLDLVDVPPDALCLDLGCGYGVIGITLACLAPNGQIHMVDRDFVAIDYAKRNAQENGLDHCHIYLSNSCSHVPVDLRFDTIAANLSAKIGNPMLAILLNDAYTRLSPGGHFYVVTISGLSKFVKRQCQALFGNHYKLKQNGTYTVALAIKSKD